MAKVPAPCVVNTSILDFHGNPKPAAINLQLALRNAQ